MWRTWYKTMPSNPLTAVIQRIRSVQSGTHSWRPQIGPDIISELRQIIPEDDTESRNLFEQRLRPALESGMYKFPEHGSDASESRLLSPYRWPTAGLTSGINISHLYGGLGAMASRIEYANIVHSGVTFKGNGEAEAYCASLITHFAGLCGAISELRKNYFPRVVQITWERDAPSNYVIATPFLAIGSTIATPSSTLKDRVREDHVKDFTAIFPDIDQDVVQPLRTKMDSALGIALKQWRGSRILHLDIKAGKKFYTMALRVRQLKKRNPATWKPWYYEISGMSQSPRDLLQLLIDARAYAPQCKNCSALSRELNLLYKAELTDIAPEEILEMIASRA
ncbi:hypothetical protein DFH06DRAFT_1471528 [Mycena polygramma]|nr:hypothetical protein DFH06DRAFT_1471528 [Mycena polygramma]